MRRVLGLVVLLSSGVGLHWSSPAAAAPLVQQSEPPVVISPERGIAGSRVVVDAACGSPDFEFLLWVQFRAADEPPRSPVDEPDGTPGVPSLPQEQLPSSAGHAVVAVHVPTGAAIGSSFIYGVCRNTGGGFLPGTEFSVPFVVTALPATGSATGALIVGAIAALLAGVSLVGLARPRSS